MDDIDFEHIPKKRQKRAKYVSMLICAITSALVIVFYFSNAKEDVYYKDEARKNTTNCFIKEEKKTFSGILITALSVIGSVVIGTAFDRLSLLAEELFHIRERYEGSSWKMIRACFSVINWGPVTLFLFLTIGIFAVITLLLERTWYELRYLVYISGGISVSPLIVRLLNLETESAVYLSAVLEETGMNVTNGLAWSYYFNYLEEALPKFDKIVNNPRRRYPLSLKKLLLLITLDCHMKDDLTGFGNIIKIGDIMNKPFHFPVYRLRVDGEETKDFAIQYVEAPLKALRDMNVTNWIKEAKRKTCRAEVKLLYRTLSEVLRHPVAMNIRRMCVLVPIGEDEESLQNGRLVKCIMAVVKHSRHMAGPDCVPGFVKLKNVRHDENQNVRDKQDKNRIAKWKKRMKKSTSTELEELNLRNTSSLVSIRIE